MKVSFIRAQKCVQGSSFQRSEYILGNSDASSNESFDSSWAAEMRQNVVISEFTFLTIGTVGWASGSRNRTKHVKSFDAIFAYLNKLHIGGWLSDSEYDEAWGIALELQFSYPSFVS